MEGKQEEKIRFLTHSKVKTYKAWLLFLMSVLIAGLAYYSYVAILDGHFIVTTPLLGCVFVYQLYRIYRRVKVVEFDREFFYVSESGYEILVPLDNIKKVEIKNMGGIYKVSFFDEIQSGHSVLFKPSLIYPLDFNKQDEKVNKLRSYAWTARSNRKPIPKNALTS